MALKNFPNFRGRKPKDLPIPPPPSDHTDSRKSQNYIPGKHIPYKHSTIVTKNVYNKQNQKHDTAIKIAKVIKQNVTPDVDHNTPSHPFNLYELQLQAQLLSDLQSLEPIIDLPFDEDSLGIEWTYTKLDSMMLNNRNYQMRTDESIDDEDPLDLGSATPQANDIQVGQTNRQLSISSNDSTCHDFNNFTYWLIKGKQNDLNAIEAMLKTPGFNYLNVPRKLLSIAAQVSSRGFFDPSYRAHLDQMDENIY